jgi:hypothetical protein
MESHILSFLVLCVLASPLTIAQPPIVNCGVHGKVGSIDVGNITFPVFCICDEGYIGPINAIYNENCCSLFQNQTLQFVASLMHPCDIPYDWKSGENVPLKDLPCYDNRFEGPKICPLLSHVESATS